MRSGLKLFGQCEEVGCGRYRFTMLWGELFIRILKVCILMFGLFMCERVCVVVLK